MSSENGQGRTRSWTFILYPESAPENWREILNELFIQWVESPLHDKDIDPGTGELKKAHWHILLMFPSVKSYEQILEITNKLNTPPPQKAMSAKGVVRYMAHMDNPEKYQYNKDEIKAYGGADIAELLRPSSGEKREMMIEIKKVIREKQITEYIDLLDVLEEIDLDLMDFAFNNTIAFNSMVRSNRFKILTDKERK